MGNDGAGRGPGDGEGPSRGVHDRRFRIGATTVTNAEFAAFVRATRHVTDAEQAGRSFVFYLQVSAADARWPGTSSPACRGGCRSSTPRGSGRKARARTCATGRPSGRPRLLADALAYCDWAGARLPSEAEWERAARGGLEGRRFAWGDELLDAAGVPRCNVFRGDFPNAPAPGWRPEPIEAASGEPNGFGLFNVCGNVWEWCADPLARRPARPARRLVPVPRLVLQPLPRRRAQREHRRYVGEQHRLSGRALKSSRRAENRRSNEPEPP